MPVFEKPVYAEPTTMPGEKKRKYQRVLSPLMQTPGEWAKIGEYKTEESAYQAASNLRKGRYLVPDGEWEFVADGREVFARYVDLRKT